MLPFDDIPFENMKKFFHVDWCVTPAISFPCRLNVFLEILKVKFNFCFDFSFAVDIYFDIGFVFTFNLDFVSELGFDFMLDFHFGFVFEYVFDVEIY